MTAWQLAMLSATMIAAEASPPFGADEPDERTRAAVRRGGDEDLTRTMAAASALPLAPASAWPG